MRSAIAASLGFLVVFASGCWNPLSTRAGAVCQYANPVSCPAERICAYVAVNRAECIPRHTGATPFFRFPFAPDHPVVCTQGPRAKYSTGMPASHSWASNQFAIDLATPQGRKKDQGIGGTVYASIDGVALVHSGCSDNPKSEEEQACGGGFGNYVRILSASGFVAFYAHLAEIWIQDGQVIRAGAPIGREGSSGKAGHRHLHFSAHYVDAHDFLAALAALRAHPNELPSSITFETQFCDPARLPSCARKRARAENIPCGGGESHPKELRADWGP